MKIIITSIILLISICSINAQDISYKDIRFRLMKETMTVKNVVRFTVDVKGSYWYIHDLENNEEIIYIYHNDNDTGETTNDDYLKVYFTSSKKYLENKMITYILFERLIVEGVIGEDWKIDESKIDDFIQKYDEKISERRCP